MSVQAVAATLIDTQRFCFLPCLGMGEHESAIERFRHGLDFQCAEIALHSTGPVPAPFQPAAEGLGHLQVAGAQAFAKDQGPGCRLTLQKMAAIAFQGGTQDGCIGWIGPMGDAVEGQGVDPDDAIIERQLAVFEPDGLFVTPLVEMTSLGVVVSARADRLWA